MPCSAVEQPRLGQVAWLVRPLQPLLEGPQEALVALAAVLFPGLPLRLLRWGSFQRP